MVFKLELPFENFKIDILIRFYKITRSCIENTYVTQISNLIEEFVVDFLRYDRKNINLSNNNNIK